jgi:hypothetical protein
MFHFSKIYGQRRAQMFILATMLIAVYIVTMAAALMNLQTQPLVLDREAIKEPYLNSKNEIQNFMELLLADYSKNTSALTNNEIFSRITHFAQDLEKINTERGIISDITLNTNNFLLLANKYPYSNVSVTSSTYTSQIYAEFKLKMSTIDSSLSIEESFSISFIGRAEIQANSIIVQQSKGDQFEFVEAAIIYILNGSTQLIPSLDPNHSGLYFFENISDLNNVGILNVTLNNGVSILS